MLSVINGSTLEEEFGILVPSQREYIQREVLRLRKTSSGYRRYLRDCHPDPSEFNVAPIKHGKCLAQAKPDELHSVRSAQITKAYTSRRDQTPDLNHVAQCVGSIATKQSRRDGVPTAPYAEVDGLIARNKVNMNTRRYACRAYLLYRAWSRQGAGYGSAPPYQPFS